jgi:hypothetical protein
MEQDRGTGQHQEQKVSFGQKWSEARPTKTLVFWSWVASVVLTMIIGFAWGGWVTGGTARKIATESSEEAVVLRLEKICVTQFNKDPAKDQKLKDLKATDSWKRSDFVAQQGWATMPGEEKPDQKVADACAKSLIAMSQ